MNSLPAVRRLIALCLVFAAPAPSARAAEPSEVAKPIRVALYDDAGTGESVDDAAKALADRPNLHIKRIKATDIRAGALDGFDVLVHPGGSGSGQAKALAEPGRERVRAFVKRGGGYVGICAGAYLASSRYDWSLHLLDATVVDTQHWARGHGNVDLAVTERGRTLLGFDRANPPVYYHQGPLLAPGGDPDLPDYEPLATFAGDIAKNGAPKGVMPGTTAIAAGRFGNGRVLCFSPHPEKTDGMRDVVERGVMWAAGQREQQP